jgi:hypothetical protein
MTAPVRLPRFDLRAYTHGTFDYDADADVAQLYATVQIDRRIEVDEGWHLRVAGHYATGVDLHGVRRMAYGDPFLAELLRAALIEMDRGPNRDPLGVLAADIARSGDMESRPQLVRLLLAATGIALGKLSMNGRAPG